MLSSTQREVLHKKSPKGITTISRLNNGLSEFSKRRTPASPGEELAGGADWEEDAVAPPSGGCVVDGIEDEDEDGPLQIPPPEQVEAVGQPDTWY